MTWSLYKEEEFLEPLCFSNGKTQKEVVDEVLDYVSKGKKIIFIRGVCGTGKSAIALNIARKLGKASIVVPGKTLQNQYKEDYERAKYLLKDNGEKLKIRVMMGRNNFKCKFLEDKSFIHLEKKEVNSNLNDIFSFSKEQLEEKRKKDLSADNWEIPCKIEIKQKNLNRLKEYIKQNKGVNPNNFVTSRDIKRMSVAPVCPYWSPVLPEKYELNNKSFKEAEKKYYTGIGGEKYIFYKRKGGCKFYEQFDAYIDADAIVFNSLKYKLESSMNRKPLTEVEIIDECDEFLDGFSNQRTINLDRLQNSLGQIFDTTEDMELIIKDINFLIREIKKDRKIESAIYSHAILQLKETKIYELLKLFLDNPEFLDSIDEESYLFYIEETARMFDEFFNDTYLTFHKKENNLIIELVTTNLAKRFKDMVDKNKVVVLMSGTIHSENVLKNIFGLEDYEIIDAETEQQGSIDVVKTGLEIDCRYDNFSNGKHSREDYLKALEKCINVGKKPILVHINSFYDLPNEEEIKRFGIENIISRERLREMQREDKQGRIVDKFKSGEIDILFSTRVSRGIDFPGEKCNSIIFTKYPNPDVKSAFWKILKQTKPMYYWEFYKDKAKRELYQRIYRGLRFKQDHVYLLSPDSRVLDVFEKKK